MHPVLIAVVALAVGLLVGVLICRTRWATAGSEPEEPFETSAPVVPTGISELLPMLSSSGIVAGPHDEVLIATVSSRTLGLVRGTRIAVPELLDLVRRVRRENAPQEAELSVGQGAHTATTLFGVRVAPLGEGVIVVLADDLTTERRIEESRRDFVANVSHELKTPIGAISLLSEAVAAAAEDPAAVRRFAERLDVEAARLTELVSQVIALSRVQADHPLSDPELVDVDAVIAEAVDRQRLDAERRQVTLTVAGPTGTRVLGNPHQLAVAIGNLVDNAVVYSDPGARVAVTARTNARSDDDWVEITVSDNGIGIAPADLERVFERFYRVDYARSRANGGTGLGLSIVKHIAAIHGGDASVWSQLGRGSTFTISIPAHLHHPDTDREHPGQEVAQ